jgi:hypothetical protein
MKAVVLNPELSDEYAILSESAILNLVKDSMAPRAVAIRLLPMESRLAPANGIFNTILSLGQVPVRYEDRYFFQFEEISEKEKAAKAFELKVASEIWFWNIFSKKKNFSKAAGQALLADYYNQ